MSWFQRQRGKHGKVDEAPSTPEPWEEDAASGDAGNDPTGDEVDAETTVDAAARDDAEARERRRRDEGPHDTSEVDDAESHVDLGALRLPPRQGMELRLEVEDKTQRVIAVTVTVAGSSLQMQAFAAPRRDGIWDDIRGEIAAGVTKQGGTADDVPGVFGREVLARIPVRTPDGRSGHRPSRFVGVDGPRWFLRGVFTGPAAVDEDAATDLEDVLRGVVVVRGADAMAPRDLLQLKLPAGAAGPQPPGGSEGGASTSGPASDPLRPFERGPEITERR